MAYSSFEDLDVWQRSCRLSIRIYALLKETRDYGLRDQMTRASVSIASNIAEGAERDSPADFKRFLHIAKGSAAELRTQVYIAVRVGVLPANVEDELMSELKRISAMIHGLIKSMKKSLA
jgi:four helix bundle protein